MKSRLDDLGREIAREQDALRARSSVRAEVRARLAALEVPKVQRRSWRGWAIGATAGALAAAVAIAVWPAEPNELEPLAVMIGEDSRPGTTGTWVEAPVGSSVAMRFSDGTRVDVAPRSRARIAELQPRGAHLLLENGLARVYVKPRANAAWRISAGPFAVKVTGTRFDVRWNPEQDAFELDLREGHVEISGCVFGESYGLNAGQRAVASCRHGRLNVGSHADIASTSAAVAIPKVDPIGEHAPVPVAPPEAKAVAVAGPVDESPIQTARPAPKPKSSKAVGRASDRWRAWAEAGRYADALALVRSTGFAAECRRADAEELLLLADLARYGRDFADEAKALNLVRRRFPGSRESTQAAFALGKLHFDRDGSYAEAAWWFRTYLRERPFGALAREASGRLLEATLRNGDTGTARELAAQYLRDYPSGPHAALAESLH